MDKIILTLLCFFTLGVFSQVYAEKKVELKFVTEKNKDKAIGEVVFADTPYGLLLTPNLHDLSPGVHGFHIHEHPSCDNSGMAAGGHLDPKNTEQHLGPYVKHSHLGDMPVLIVDENGMATLPVLVPRLTVKQIRQRAIMIHDGPDNYSNTPPMGGGGSRLACAAISFQE